jgi:hypothetical protein
MTEHLDSPYVRVTGDGGVLWVERKSTPYPDLDTFQAEMMKAMASVPDDGSAYAGVVLDSRAVIGRNDDAFEQAADAMVRVALARVPRMAMLMKSAVGVLQGQRMSGEDERLFITNDEQAARRFATTGER